MGKRPLVRRRGRGSPTFRAPSVGRVADARLPPLPSDASARGIVEEIVHERGRPAPLARIRLDGGSVFYVPAAAGMYVGQEVHIGPNAPLAIGNILPLARIPEGSKVCNVELRPGDGGRISRAAGSSALVYSNRMSWVTLKLPSGKMVKLSGTARAMLGQVAGAGRLEKPLLRAGASYWKHRRAGRKWPLVRGVAMSAWYHPHGGGRHQKVSHPSSVPRTAPPGQKVGNIAPRKTGRGKLRKRVEEVSR
jgi:large subunit ribosomal protein L2